MNDQPLAVVENDNQYARFRIGRGLALVSPPTFVLVDPSNGAFGERLWALMEDESGVDGLLEELSAAGLRSLGDFAMAQIEGDELRVVVRGQATASVLDGEATIDLEAGSVKTWVEAVFDSATGFSLSIGGAAGDELMYRLGRGIVPADQVAWGDLQHGSLELGSVKLDWTDSFEPTAVGKRQSRITSGVDAIDDSGDPRVEPQPRVVAAVESGEVQDADADAYDFDALYGRTVAKTVQDAAMAAEPEDVPSPFGPGEPAPGSSEVAVTNDQIDAPGELTLAAPSNTIAESGLIESVPTAVKSAPAPGTDGPQVERSGEQQLGDHDGMTISAARLREIRGQAVGGDSVAPTGLHSGPAVQAMLCSEGHANPAHAESCLRCAEVLRGTPVMVPRPPLGQLVFSTGRTVELDRPAIFGRSPRAQGNMPNEMPRLVAFKGDDLLSRSHAMIRLESWHVLVEDLGSRNGTIVTLPGREPRRLMVGEPVMLEPGAEIEFSDELSATYHGIG